jgi:hypothetical protein
VETLGVSSLCFFPDLFRVSSQKKADHFWSALKKAKAIIISPEQEQRARAEQPGWFFWCCRN